MGKSLAWNRLYRLATMLGVPMADIEAEILNLQEEVRIARLLLMTAKEKGYHAHFWIPVAYLKDKPTQWLCLNCMSYLRRDGPCGLINIRYTASISSTAYEKLSARSRS